jgi:transposase
VLFCAWLAWSRFRVVVPLRDKTLPSVVIGLDRTSRAVGGVLSYALTDNEKTVTVEPVAGIAVRNPTIVEVSRHYGLTIATCEPADPQSKGRQRGDGEDREGRSGPDRSQPPGGVSVLR